MTRGGRRACNKALQESVPCCGAHTLMQPLPARLGAIQLAHAALNIVNQHPQAAPEAPLAGSLPSLPQTALWAASPPSTRPSSVRPRPAPQPTSSQGGSTCPRRWRRRAAACSLSPCRCSGCHGGAATRAAATRQVRGELGGPARCRTLLPCTALARQGGPPALLRATTLCRCDWGWMPGDLPAGSRCRATVSERHGRGQVLLRP